jgi:type IV secretory pathway TrbD component
VPESLSTHFNRGGLHDIDVAPSLETDDSFVVSLVNHGAPIHVHLHLDDDLSDAASLAATNHYIEADSTEVVRVRVHDGPASGKLKVVTGYGAESAYVDVDIAEKNPETDSIPIDESLSKPKRRPVTRTDESSELARNLPLFVLGALALVLVLGVGFLVDWFVALFGALMVFVGLGAARYFLAR